MAVYWEVPMDQDYLNRCVSLISRQWSESGASSDAPGKGSNRRVLFILVAFYVIVLAMLALLQHA